MSGWPATFAASVAIGVAVAAPVGPVGVLCAQRTLRGGFAVGVASGLGVATADGLYATAAALGMAALTTFISGVSIPLRGLGGAVLLYLAWRTWRAPAGTDGPAPTGSARGLLGAYASTLALTLANPATILSFAAILAGLGAGTRGPATGPLFVAGVATGSLAWWVFLAAVVGGARRRAPGWLVVGAGRASAVLLAAAAIASLASAVVSVASGR